MSLWVPAAALVVAGLVGKKMLAPKNPLNFHEGRRAASEVLKRSPEYYSSKGVIATEEFIRNSRGVELFTKRWLPESGDIKGLILYCHGYGDCCNYFFEDVAMTLVASKYAVFGIDYEGFGQSEGLHCFIHDFNTLVGDVIEYADSIKEREEFKNLPSFLYGESMGGAVVLKIHLRQPEKWNGGILLAPMCKIADEMKPPEIVTQTLKLISPIFPKWQLVPHRDILDKAFRVKEKKEKAENHPTYYKLKPRVQTALQLLSVTEEISANLSKVSFPMLILHGGSDTVTAPDASIKLHEVSSSNDKTLNVYPASWHSLIAGEPEDVVENVFSDILTWLDARSRS